jgi:hypothetical protein
MMGTTTQVMGAVLKVRVPRRTHDYDHVETPQCLDSARARAV